MVWNSFKSTLKAPSNRNEAENILRKVARNSGPELTRGLKFGNLTVALILGTSVPNGSKMAITAEMIVIAQK